MKTVSIAIFATTLVVAAGAALAAEEGQTTAADIPETWQGVLFVNGLGTPIIDAFARPREHCDVYLCDEWRDLAQEGWLLQPDKAVAMGVIFSPPEKGPRVCQWAVKVVTQDALTYEFEPLDVCVPDVRNRIDFRADKDSKVAAVHWWKDEEGAWQKAIVPSK